MKLSKTFHKEMKKKKNQPYFFILLLLFIGTVFYEFYSEQQLSQDRDIFLIKCIDGDTAELSINGKNEKVRFLAIDTPEIGKGNTPAQPFANEAATKTCNLLSNASAITLEYEIERYDRYNRTLAWVWVDGSLLQEDLIKEGLAEVKYLYGDYKYTDILKIAENLAKKDNIGIWSTR